MRLSIGVPVHNEEEVLPELIPRLLAVLDRMPGGPHEAVFVDDGSTDGTRQFLKDVARRDARLKVVALSRNFGHQAALGAAIDHATGDAIVLMDGDLQDEPEIIPELVRQYEAGADVVYTRRASREEGLWLRLAYRLYYRIMSWLSEVDLPLDSGDFALLGPPVVAALRGLPERQRYSNWCTAAASTSRRPATPPLTSATEASGWRSSGRTARRCRTSSTTMSRRGPHHLTASVRRWKSLPRWVTQPTRPIGGLALQSVARLGPMA